MSDVSQTKVAPPKAGLLLSILILGAFVSNVNLSIANVALSTVGRDLDASQSQLTVVASSFSMALAATVLYLGAIGDRYGRKMLLLCGAALTVPGSILGAWAPNIQVLIGARVLSGIAAGLLFPTTLSLISALWGGSARTKAIALWSGIGGGAAALGSVIGGVMLEEFWWGSVFLFAAPFAVIVFVLALVYLPWHAGEEVFKVDHLGGVLSVIGVATLIAGIQKVSGGFTVTLLVLFVIAIIALTLFLIRQKNAPRPLMDLHLARQRTFWVAAVSGTVSFGSLLGAMFIGQQFVQNVLGYDTLKSALTAVPSAIGLAVLSPVAARVLIKRGGRFTLVLGIAVIAVAFVEMLVLWRPDAQLWTVLLAYGIVGCGVAFAAAAACRALMASVPVSRAGMGSAFTDLTRDFGGAIMQAIMGTVLAIVYTDQLTTVFNGLTPTQAAQFSTEAAQAIGSSFGAAEDVATHYPPSVATQIISAASDAFSKGKSLAFVIALVLVIASLLVSWLRFPNIKLEMDYYEEIAERSDEEQSEPATASI